MQEGFLRPKLGGSVGCSLAGKASAQWLLALILVGYLTGCNSASSPPPPPVDSQPPTAPTNLAATANGSSEIDLSWTASTDNVGVTGYRVERCQGAGCSNFAQIAAPTGTTFNNTGLTASTSYSYRVRAADAANNLSPFSNVATTSTAAAGPVTITISPKRGSVTTSQTQQFTATVTGSTNMTVTWEVDSQVGGNATVGTINASGLYTPPATGGSHSITARSVADTTKTDSATFGVTDLAGVFTHRYDAQRTGQNRQEYALTSATVSIATFGKLFSCLVDGEVYAQPLYVANLTIVGGTHNVVFVATQHNSVYAFDADKNPCQQYWKTSFLSAGVTPVPPADTLEAGDIRNEIGITGTPVIDPASKTLYVVAKTKEQSGCGALPSPCYRQRLHALDLATGNEKFNGPANISNALTVPGNGDLGDSTCPSTSGVPFCPLRENQRPALLLSNGKVYIAWGSHGDHAPYHGWVIGYSASDLSAAPVAYNVTPNGGSGGIWQSGSGPAADSSGNIYAVSGNGNFDGLAGPPVPAGTDLGDSIIKLSTASGLAAVDFFTPFNQGFLSGNDFDLGSGGPVVLPDSVGSNAHRHLLVAGDKQGKLFLVDRDSLGGFCSGCTTVNTNIVQELPVNGPACITCGVFSSPAIWEGHLYVVPVDDRLKSLSITNAIIASSPTSVSGQTFGFPGATPMVSSQNATSGMVWLIDSNPNGTGTGSSSPSGPAILHAYDALNVANEFWASTQASGGRDTAGNAVKFTVPTVANGKVYVGTQTELTVYGLLPN